MSINDENDTNSIKNLENNDINVIVGTILLFFSFIMVLFSIFGTNLIPMDLNFILLDIVVLINLLGYALVLLPIIPDRLKYIFEMDHPFSGWIILPLSFILSVIFITLITDLKETSNLSNPVIILKYLLYIIVPITIVSLTKIDALRFFFKNKIIDLILYLFILFWVWWGIEFTNDINLFPDLVKGFGYLLNLLAIATLTWSFFVLNDYEIQRSFTKLFTISNFKIILSFLAILLIIIVPIGLYVSFLKINFVNLTSKGFFGYLGYIFLAVVGVFLVQGIGEELLFRGFFYFTLMNKIKQFSEKARGYIMVILFFFVASLIALTPYIGLANPIKSGIVESGVIPLKTIYPVIAIIYFAIGIILMIKTKNISYAMVLWSSMLFGWAHFEDWRYLIFATVAGLGYCETYKRTDNLFAASVLHMLVDVIWGAILTT